MRKCPDEVVNIGDLLCNAAVQPVDVGILPFFTICGLECFFLFGEGSESGLLVDAHVGGTPDVKKALM